VIWVRFFCWNIWHFLMCIINKAWFSYVGKIPIGLGFHCFPTVPDFADTSNIRQRFVPNFPDYEFGGTWKARETSKLEHKCNSISVTWMHTSLLWAAITAKNTLNWNEQSKQKWFSDGLQNEIIGFEMELSKYGRLSVLLRSDSIKNEFG